jgi:hypothetical protein
MKSNCGCVPGSYHCEEADRLWSAVNTAYYTHDAEAQAEAREQYLLHVLTARLEADDPVGLYVCGDEDTLRVYPYGLEPKGLRSHNVFCVRPSEVVTRLAGEYEHRDLQLHRSLDSLTVAFVAEGFRVKLI